MALPYHNLRSKLNRAIRAWLISQDCGTENDIHVGFNVKDRDFPLTTIRAAIGTPMPHFSGNYSIRTMITVKGRAQQNSDGDPELARILFDERLAKTFDALMQTDDNQTLRFTAKSITSAGRGLVPTTLALTGAGTSGANGSYTQASSILWNRDSGNYSINLATGVWEIRDGASAVKYNCLEADFPKGPWEVAGGSSPVPKFKQADNWDMADFSVIQWLEAGFGEPEAEDDGCDWAETIMFDAVCCPSNVGGYSLTD